MKNILKNAALILTVFILAAAVPSFAAEGTQMFSESAYADGIEVFKRLDLWNNALDSMQKSDNVDRKTFSLLIKSVYGDKNTYNGDFFSDTPEDELYKSAVNFAAVMSLMNGSGESFEPEAYITLEQALKVAVTMLGKSEIADAKGGYPDGYIKTAAEINLSDGISAGYGEPLKWGAAVTLIYNTVHRNVSIRVPAVGSRFEFKDGELFIAHNLNIVFKTGILNQAGRYTLETESRDSDADITVDSTVMHADNGSLYYDYLGFSVEYWYRKDSDGSCEILYLRPHSRKNNIVIIEPEDISKAESSLIEYFDENNNKIRLTPDEDCSFVYNGRLLTKPGEFNLKPVSGKIIAIDNNRDGIYDVINIISFGGSYVVENISEINRTVFDLFGRTLSLDGNNAVIRKNGNIISFSEIKTGDVITVAHSFDGKFTTAYVNNNKESAKVTEIYNGEKYIVNGVERRLSQDYISNLGSTYAPSLSAGAGGTFYYDESGAIAAVSMQSGDMQYGYVIAKSDGADLRDSYSIKLLTEYEGVKEYIVPSKFSLNKNRATPTDLLNYPGLKDSVIRFRANNDNEITAVLTANSTRDFSCDAARQSMSYRNGGRCFDGRYSMGLDTRIMYVTGRKEDGDSGYYVSPKIILGDLSYSVDIYDTDEYNIMGLVVVRLDKYNGKIMLESERPAMVKELNKTLNAEGAETYLMTVIYKGKEFSYTLQNCEVADKAVFADEAISQNTVYGIKAGDIIHFRTHDTTGEAVAIERLYRADTKTFFSNVIPTPSAYNGKYRYTTGKLKSLKEGIAVLELPDGSLENYYVGGKSYSYYDKDNRIPVDLTDIASLYNCVNNDEWTVVLYMHYSVVYDVYMYHN